MSTIRLPLLKSKMDEPRGYVTIESNPYTWLMA